jgi:hypothetical protein
MNFKSRLTRRSSNHINEAGEIPSYNAKRQIIDRYRVEFAIKIFIESGTFLGDTTNFLKNEFDQLYTIELSIDLANRAKDRFKGNNKVEVIQGDSGEVLKSLVPKLSQPALFWLDGHYSSEFFYDGEYFVTAKAEINTPIEKEIEAILHSTFLNVILIDDARLFVGESDYPTVDAIKNNIVKSGLAYDFFVEKDIIHIIPKKNGII